MITELESLSKGVTDMPCYHIAIKCDTDIRFIKPGDAIEIKPQNPYWLVKSIASLVDASDDKKLLETLKCKKEITTISHSFIKEYNKFAENKKLRALQLDAESLQAYINKANVLDVLTDYPGKINANQLIDSLSKIKKRLYSVASTSVNGSNELHLTVKAIRYQFNGFKHEGAGSNQLTQQFVVGKTLQFKHKPNLTFRLPENNVPIVMIGVGTGIAPFRGFLMERQYHGTLNNSWLIWGDKNRKRDFLYEDQLMEMYNNQTLGKIDVAFSRDGIQKEYVQDIVQQQKDELYRWLKKGAHIYVCGSLPMAKSVKETIQTILKDKNNPASIHYDDLLAQNRYHEDAY